MASFQEGQARAARGGAASTTRAATVSARNQRGIASLNTSRYLLAADFTPPPQ